MGLSKLTTSNKWGVSMNKKFVVVALAMIMVLAFAGTAFAAGSSPANRSSSFLAKGESYVSWDKAQTQMALAGESAVNTVSVHGNYTTTTVKCQVCHSAHKAAAAGDTLLQSTAAKACVPCHLGATAASALKVSEGNRHGSDTGCTSGYCHAVAPHGAGDISEYATLKTAMLTVNADSMLKAAIKSGVDNAPAEGFIYELDGSAVLATMTVSNPGVTTALLNDVSTADSIAYGRAIGTGYVCSNGGCHMNGQFNSTTETATLSAWGGPFHLSTDAVPGQMLGYSIYNGPATVPAGDYGPTDEVLGTDGVTMYNVWDIFDMRQDSIKGHTLAAVSDLAVRDVAYANVGTCMSCHDSIDYRISTTAKQFPHGNNRVMTDGTIPASPANTSAAWFTAGSYLGSTDTTVTDRGGAVTTGSDGSCLKCHRDGTNGVGIDY